MAERSMALLEHLRNQGLEPDSDFLREAAKLVAELVMELEVSEQIGAERHERSATRKTQRNGYRERPWETRVGEIPLRIPKLREGSYFPSLLEPRRRAEKALWAVIQQAYIEGVSTRKVDDLLQALGLTGIDKSRVSRICKELDQLVQRFRERPLSGAYPYLWLDAVYLKARQNHRIVSLAVVIAIAVRETGEREIIGLASGASESEAFWAEFLRSLVRRGLAGVQLVISDAHEGLKAAIGQVLSGTTWQRCRVHFMRNLLAHVPQADKALVAAVVRTIFAQPTRAAALQTLREVEQKMRARWPKAAQLLSEAADDVLAYMDFPAEHWTRLYSTNVVERLNKEVKRRTNVVGVFPDDASVIRLVGAVLLEIADEWAIERRYFSQTSMQQLGGPNPQGSLPKEAPRLAPVR